MVDTVFVSQNGYFNKSAGFISVPEAKKSHGPLALSGQIKIAYNDIAIWNKEDDYYTWKTENKK